MENLKAKLKSVKKSTWITIAAIAGSFLFLALLSLIIVNIISSADLNNREYFIDLAENQETEFDCNITVKSTFLDCSGQFVGGTFSYYDDIEFRANDVYGIQNGGASGEWGGKIYLSSISRSKIKSWIKNGELQIPDSLSQRFYVYLTKKGENEELYGKNMEISFRFTDSDKEQIEKFYKQQEGTKPVEETKNPAVGTSDQKVEEAQNNSSAAPAPQDTPNTTSPDNTPSSEEDEKCKQKIIQDEFPAASPDAVNYLYAGEKDVVTEGASGEWHKVDYYFYEVEFYGSKPIFKCSVSTMSWEKGNWSGEKNYWTTHVSGDYDWKKAMGYGAL